MDLEKVAADSKRIAEKLQELEHQAGQRKLHNTSPSTTVDIDPKNNRVLCGWREDEDDRYSSRDYSFSHSPKKHVCHDNQEMMRAVLHAFFKTDHDAAQFEQYKLENDFSQPGEVRKAISHLETFVNPGYKILLTVFLIIGLGTAGLKAQEVKGPQALKIGDKVRDVTRIRGQVISADDHKPLSGAVIKLKGTLVAISTDSAGRFSLAATLAQRTFMVSYLGYETKEVEITEPPSEILVTLQRAINSLREVVVSTGYQDLPLERATGSFAAIDMQQFNRQVSTDVISRLKAVAPSLLFDERSGSPKLIIRGRSTIFANDQPLIVVDNFPYDGDINNINPNDIEDITILRDAAAASIWGVRAGNGVIVIKTRSGKLNQPPTIRFNSNFSIGERPDLRYQSRITTGDFIEVEKTLFAQGFYNSEINNMALSPPLTPVVQLLDMAKKGKISDGEAQDRINSLKGYDIRNDLSDHVYRKSFNQQYAVNMNGGSDRHTYYIGAGFDRNLSSAVGNDLNRFTLNGRETFRPFKALEIRAGINYVQSDANRDNTLSQLSMGGPKGRVLYPYARLTGDAGEPLSVIKDFTPEFKQTAEGVGLLNWNYVPLDEIALNDNITMLSDVRLNTAFNYRFLKDFSIEGSYQYQRQVSDFKRLYHQDSYYTRNLSNGYSLSGATGFISEIPSGGILDRSEDLLTSQNFRGQLNYSRSWSKHQVAVLAGAEVKAVAASGNSNRFYGYDSNTGATQSVNYNTFFRLYPDGFGFIPANENISLTKDRFLSYYSNASYTIDDRYTFSASGRIDQSNLFGVNSNQRSVPLWSGGFKWALDREEFYNLDWMPELSIRASYGFNGNIDRSVTAFTTAGFSTSSTTGQPAATIHSPPNPNLRWEKTGILNLAVDFATKESRISGRIEHYRKKGTDLIGYSPLDPTAGLLSYRGNVADMKGHGWDVELKSINTKRRIRWSSSLLFSYTSDEVTGYNITPVFASYMADASLIGNTPDLFSPTVGRPLFGVYSRRWAGLDPQKGDPMGYVNGQVSKNYSALISSVGKTVDSLIYHGRALPPVFGALGNALNYKGFTVSFNLSYRFGYYFRNKSIGYGDLFNRGVGHGDFTYRWQQPGDEKSTNVPSMPLTVNSSRDSFYATSETLVERGDNIRLQDVSLSYQFDGAKVKRLPMKSMEFYFYANNLGLLWKASSSGTDPDFPSQLNPVTISVGFKTNL